MIKCRAAILALATAFLTSKLAEGYGITPFTLYHLCMMNELSKATLHMKCYPGRDPQKMETNNDVLVIPAHNSYNWSFHPIPLATKKYLCHAEAEDGHSVIMFLAFMDNKKFVDGRCGGNHCIWKFADDGIYLYNIPTGKFNWATGWNKMPPPTPVNVLV